MKRYSPYFRGEEKNMFDATWQYMKDHCEVQPNGIFFIQFHVADKAEFERKIRSRMKGLHRDRSSDVIALDRKQKAIAKELEIKAKKEEKKLISKRIREGLIEVTKANQNRNLTVWEKMRRIF